MALVFDVTYAKTSKAKSFIYKDASFKTIDKVLPKYVEFSLSDCTSYKGKRGISIERLGRIPKKIFTFSGRRYDIVPYDFDGNFIFLEKILVSEGIVGIPILENSQQWKVQLSAEILVSDNSLFDKAAIKNSIKNLFTFCLRERIILPEYGSCLNDLIGSSMTDGQVIVAKEMIEKMMNWEPRIKFISSDIIQDRDNYEIQIKISYSIPVLKIASDSLLLMIKVSDD